VSTIAELLLSQVGQPVAAKLASERFRASSGSWRSLPASWCW
jgi:hypothetical protein